MIMAMEAWARFSTASPNFVHICDSHMQASAIAMADSKDAILFFSYSGSTRDMCDTLQIASSRHVPVILITHFPKSAGAEFASVVLQCGYNESPLQSGSVAAKVGQLFLDTDVKNLIPVPQPVLQELMQLQINCYNVFEEILCYQNVAG